MKQLTCEICGSTELIKDGGFFVCQTCGTKYSVEEAKKMMIEGNVDVQSTVNVYKTTAVEEKNSNHSFNADLLVLKIICMLGGIIGVAVGGYIVYSDRHDWFGYTYELPLSRHEMGIISVIIASIIVFIIGCCISSHSNNRN